MELSDAAIAEAKAVRDQRHFEQTNRTYRLWRDYLGTAEIVGVTINEVQDRLRQWGRTKTGEFVSDDEYDTFQEAITAWGHLVGK